MSHRILVIDDNPAIHQDFRKILCEGAAQGETLALEAALFDLAPPTQRVAAFELDAASSGEAGVRLMEAALAAERPYAVAFVDVRMPLGWDGIETTERLFALDGELQVVLCTAYSDHSWDQIAERLGATDRLLILRKPFDNVEVRQLASALTAKWVLARDNRAHLRDLDRRIAQASDARVELERQLIHAQRLESLGRMVASIGHEINNPLSFVTANLKMARAELMELDETTQNKCVEIDDMLEEAFQGAERIAQIVSDVKVFSHSRGESAHVPVQPDLVVQGALRLLENQLRHRATVTVQLDALPLILGEQRRLEQVFMNLFVNAMDALPEDREKERSIRVWGRVDGGFVVIDVTDSGTGIAPEHLARIFEPFYTTKAVGRGTGLGLPICKAIIEAHGGRISVDSRVGRGTTVQVALPVTETAPARIEVPAVVQAAKPTQGKILIVDDEPKILSLLERTLKGYTTTSATSGNEALARCRTASFDLILCDLMMPGVSGIEVYNQLKRVAAEQAGRIVFMTGGVFDDNMRAGVVRSGRPCIDKPFDPSKVRALVAAELSRP